MASPAIRLALQSVLVPLIMGALLFTLAGSLDYLQGWLYVLIFLSFTLSIVAWLDKNDAELIARRLKQSEKGEARGVQKLAVIGGALSFFLILAVEGFSFRFGLLQLPLWVSVIGCGLLVVGFAVVFLSFRENTHASSVIEVEKGQKVVSSGVYSHVRHPMYSGVLLVVTASPIVLGSVSGFPFAFLLCGLVVLRLLDEERVLLKDLPGYGDYRERVKERLIPGLW